MHDSAYMAGRANATQGKATLREAAQRIVRPAKGSCLGHGPFVFQLTVEEHMRSRCNSAAKTNYRSVGNA
jgi:hypothetical protein